MDSKTLDKIEMFNKEISYIKDERIKESAKVLINHIPNYFFSKPASTTGKYHPSFSLGESGLLRHTKTAVRIAKTILDNETFGCFYTNNEKDLIILAIILHDSVKCGDNEEYTRFDHPLLSSQLVEKYKEETKLTKEEIELLKNMIEKHMGPWINDYNGNKILEKPKTKCERFVHLCDYLSSQKFLDVKFNNNDITY